MPETNLPAGPVAFLPLNSSDRHPVCLSRSYMHSIYNLYRSTSSYMRNDENTTQKSSRTHSAPSSQRPYVNQHMHEPVKATGDSLLIHAFAYSLFISLCSVTSNMTSYSHSYNLIKLIQCGAPQRDLLNDRMVL